MSKVKLTKIALLFAALLSRGMDFQTGGLANNGFITAHSFDNAENNNEDNLIEDIKKAADNPTDSNLNRVANTLNNYTDEAKDNLITALEKSGLELRKVADVFARIDQPALGFQLVGA